VGGHAGRLVLAALLGVTCQAGVVASPAPAASSAPTPVTTPTAVPTVARTATPTPAAPALPHPFALIVQAGETVSIRSEADGLEVATLPGGSAPPAGQRVGPLAVSSDGRLVAYWTTPESGRNELHLWDPRQRRDVVLQRSPAGEVGTGIAWSADGSGLLLSFSTVARLPGIDGPPERSFLRVLYVLTPAQTSELTRADRTSFLPVAWDLPQGVAAAIEIGAGGFAANYVLIRPGQITRTRLQNTLGVDASTDAAWIVATRNIQTAGEIVAWPIAEPDKQIVLAPPADRAVRSYGFVPGTSRVIVGTTARVVTAGSQTTFSLWAPATNERRSIPGDPTGSFARPRSDGTALYLGDGQGAYLVELTSGRRSPLPNMGTTLILASVNMR
jgi:hypothetical protein